jgi:hypothetical protein
MENINYFISSRGIIRSTTNHNSQPCSSSIDIDTDLISKNDCINSVYVCTDALENFSDNFLKNIKKKFNLISGDSDICVDDEFICKKAITEILRNPHLNAWYAQNLNVKNSKISQLPIGMDYHTMWEVPGLWGLTKQSSIAQERALIDVLASAPATFNRFSTAYCNWHFAIERGDRKDCFDKIQKEFCFFESSHLPRMSTWRRQANCIFVISPQGAGMDCHRTWEAMLLGSIPIIKRSTFTEIFSDLPVIILDDWSECYRENIENIAAQMGSKKFNYSKLFLNYWASIINGNDLQAMDLMTMNEFKSLVCHESY